MVGYYLTDLLDCNIIIRTMPKKIKWHLGVNKCLLIETGKNDGKLIYKIRF